MEVLELIEAPAPLIEVTEAKSFLRLDDADRAVINDDPLVSNLVDTATAFLDGEDGFLGRALGKQRWRLTLDAFPREGIDVPLPPLRSVESIAYIDPGGITRILAPAEYRVLIPGAACGLVRSTSAWGFPATSRDGAAVMVEFTAGYEEVPAPIRTAILQHVGLLYENRESAALGNGSFAQVPFAGRDLIESYRLWVF